MATEEERETARCAFISHNQLDETIEQKNAQIVDLACRVEELNRQWVVDGLHNTVIRYCAEVQALAAANRDPIDGVNSRVILKQLLARERALLGLD